MSLHFTPTVEVLDANMAVGHRRDAWQPSDDRSSLLAELDRHGTLEALVFHNHASSISPTHGQSLLDDWLGGEKRLIPQTCVLPDEASLQLLDRTERDGALTSARIAEVQRYTNLPFTAEFFGPLLRWLEDRRVPLWVPAQQIDLRDLIPTLRPFSHLPSVLTGMHFSESLWVEPIMRQLPMLHLELSRYEPLGQVERLIKRFGAERFVYGSGYPSYAIGPVIYYLHHCNISSEQLTAICRNNVKRLLTRDGPA